MADSDVDFEDVMDCVVVSVDGDAFLADMADRDDVIKVRGHGFSKSQVALADRGKVVEGARFVWRRTTNGLVIEF